MPTLKRSAVTGRFITKSEGRAMGVTIITGKGQKIHLVNRVAAEKALRNAASGYLSPKSTKK